jgi:hypothetical protein
MIQTCNQTSKNGKPCTRPLGHCAPHGNLWCSTCGQAERKVGIYCAACHSARGKRWVRANKALHRDMVRTCLRRLKLEVVSHYCGGDIRCQCAGCPIRHIDLLTVDHVRGDGYRHRTQTNKKLNGQHIYYWLRTNNFPTGFQILCGACNIAKRNNVSCPRYGQDH